MWKHILQFASICCNHRPIWDHLRVRVVLCGAGSWAQGWHLPQLRRHADVDREICFCLVNLFHSCSSFFLEPFCIFLLSQIFQPDMEREPETHQCELIRQASKASWWKSVKAQIFNACGIRGNPSVELVAIVDPAMVTWSKYNLDMKPTKELAEMYQVLMATLRFGEGFGSKHS